MSDRPIYENEASLKGEADTIFEVNKAWKVDLVKMPIKNKIDCLMKRKSDGEPKAFVELKRRTCKRHKYPTYMISLDKWVAGLSLEMTTKLPFILVVDWLNEIGYLKCHDVINEITVNMGGRSDRSDAQDIEPVVHIPIYLFETLVKHDG